MHRALPALVVALAALTPSLFAADYPTVGSALAAGQKHLDAKEWLKALAAFDRAVELDPKRADAYRGRAWVLSYIIGKEKAALDDADKAVELDGKNDANYLTRAQLLVNLKDDYKAAIADLDRAVELGPKQRVNYNTRGFCWKQLKEYEKAIPDFDAALKLDPKYVNALQHRAECHYSLGEYETALKDFEAAVKLETGKNSRLHYTHGERLMRLERFEEAIPAFEKSVDQTKLDSWSYTAVGNCRYELGEYRKALEAFDKAATADPDDANVQRWRTATLTQLGRDEEAKVAKKLADKLEAKAKK